MTQHQTDWRLPGTAMKGALLGVGLFILFAAGVWTAPVAVTHVHAQDGPRLTSLEIGIWPEYDRAATLVILRGELPADVTLPAEVSLRIPASSGGPSAVASATVRGGALANTTYELVQDDDSLLLTITTPDPFFQVEFYDPLATDSPDREYTYVWSGDLAVDELSVRVQEPATSAELTVEPDLGPGITEPDGLIYHSAELGTFEAGKTLTIDVRYRKTDPRTSLDVLGAATDTGSDGGLPSWVLPAALVAAGVVAAVAFVYWRTQRQPALAGEGPAAGPRRKGERARRPGRAPTSQAFCTQCGNRLSPGDRFCSQCGTSARDS